MAMTHDSEKGEAGPVVHRQRVTPRRVVLFGISLLSALVYLPSAFAWTPLAVSEDPLVRMPGTQPGVVTLADPGQCFSCHADFDAETEPARWRGSMMAQAARDPLFWAAMTVTAQDSIWALGRPNATDLCLRCHFPQGWLEGRSDPTNASLMTGSDYDGVHCAFCHRLVDPFFATTYDGTREGNDWSGHWDESEASDTSSAAAADDTYLSDQSVTSLLEFFSGLPMYDPVSDEPVSSGYTESAGGQYVVDPSTDRRGPFADANASHPMIYSRFHKSRYFCSTCHDVSNTVFANLDFAGLEPGDGGTVLPSESQSAFAYGHVERTFSEFMTSAFGVGEGAEGSGAFAPEQFDTSRPGNLIATCQDCHMPDVVGKAASQKKAVLRPTESIEHPGSGVPSHELTGGNAWVPWLLASAVPGSPNHDPVNEDLLGQGAAVLTLDLNQGLGLDPAALLDTSNRALATLQSAASIEGDGYNVADGTFRFRVRNHTGHKLISGFPEGRRMWLNLRAYDADGALLNEVNPYDTAAETLKGLSGYAYDTGDLPAPAPLASNENHVDEWIYEMQASSTLTGETHTFHLALADARYKDNRIPPREFRIAEAAERLIEPVWQGQSRPDWFSAEEYAGGFDDVAHGIPDGTTKVDVHLYYQTTSREFVEFLRGEINGTGGTLTGPGAGGDPAYLAQTDPFFDQLRAWGDTLWSLWLHNRDVAGASPVEMAEAEFHVCTPLLLTGVASGGHQYQGCPTVTVGTGWHVANTADVQLRASERIVVQPGFTVEQGARLEFRIDSELPD